jgi:hypothetical protein
MRLFGPGSISTPARILLDAFLVIAGFLVALQVVVVAVLLVNPLHPVREHFQVTTLATVPAEIWRTADLVRVEPGTASARVDPWAYITYQPTSRLFVFVAAMASFLAWGCVLLVLLSLRRAFGNIAAGTPFPRDNIRRIRLAGWGVLGFAAMELLIDAGMFAYMRATTTVAGQPPVIPTAMLLVDFPLGTILAGLAVVILAELFRAGADLQDDQALTV